MTDSQQQIVPGISVSSSGQASVDLVNGRIHESWVSDGELWGDASCLMEEFFGSSGFDPGSQSDHGFGVFAEPVNRVAFNAEIDDSADRAFDRSAANRQVMVTCPAVVHPAMLKAVGDEEFSHVVWSFERRCFVRSVMASTTDPISPRSRRFF